MGSTRSCSEDRPRAGDNQRWPVRTQLWQEQIHTLGLIVHGLRGVVGLSLAAIQSVTAAAWALPQAPLRLTAFKGERIDVFLQTEGGKIIGSAMLLGQDG